MPFICIILHKQSNPPYHEVFPELVIFITDELWQSDRNWRVKDNRHAHDVKISQVCLFMVEVIGIFYKRSNVNVLPLKYKDYCWWDQRWRKIWLRRILQEAVSGDVCMWWVLCELRSKSERKSSFFSSEFNFLLKGSSLNSLFLEISSIVFASWLIMWPI